VRIAFRLAK